MSEVNFRGRARKHLAEAKRLLDTGQIENGRVACLYLRLAIEALVYDRLSSLRAEVPFEAMKNWQPKKVLEELLAIDPGTDQTREIKIAFNDPSGKLVEFGGTDHRLSMRWIEKNYNALGSWLHESTLASIEDGKESATEKAFRRAKTIYGELENVVSSPIWNFNSGQYVECTCDCGFIIKRKESVVSHGARIRCGKCDMMYLFEWGPNRKTYVFTPFDTTFRCGRCGNQQQARHENIRKNNIVTCSSCGQRHKIVEILHAEPIPDDTAKSLPIWDDELANGNPRPTSARWGPFVRVGIPF